MKLPNTQCIFPKQSMRAADCFLQRKDVPHYAYQHRSRFFTMRKHIFVFVILLSMALPFGAGSYAAGENDLFSYRLQVASKLFPRIAATDLSLDAKINEDGVILLVIFYQTNHNAAQKLSTTLSTAAGNIGGIPIKYQLSNSIKDIEEAAHKPLAIFISERVETESLHTLIKFGRDYQRLIFSPHEGDVERGVSAGIHVGNKIIPYFNIRALANANLTLNQRLLQVSIRYE